MDAEGHISRHSFPPGVQVSSSTERQGITVFRIAAHTAADLGPGDRPDWRGGRDECCSTVPDQLKRHLVESLPVVEPGEEYPRLAFQGD